MARGIEGKGVNVCFCFYQIADMCPSQGDRGIFDSKCTVACKEDGTPLQAINEADWVEEEAETPEERKARLERERQEKVAKLMKMMQDHDKAGAPGGNSNNDAKKANAAPPKNDSTEGESDSD